MNRMWHRWLALLERREPAQPLALCRIMAGIGLLGSIGVILMPGAQGMLWVDDAWGGYRDLGSGPWPESWLGGPRPLTVGVLAGTAMLAGCGLALGVCCVQERLVDYFDATAMGRVTHATTLGGNCVSMAVAAESLKPTV